MYITAIAGTELCHAAGLPPTSTPLGTGHWRRHCHAQARQPDLDGNHTARGWRRHDGRRLQMHTGPPASRLATSCLAPGTPRLAAHRPISAMLLVPALRVATTGRWHHLRCDAQARQLDGNRTAREWRRHDGYTCIRNPFLSFHPQFLTQPAWRRMHFQFFLAIAISTNIFHRQFDRHHATSSGSRSVFARRGHWSTDDG
ncbi:hypothetical protein SEVIR_7G135850v4 [Setaria viridis]